MNETRIHKPTTHERCQAVVKAINASDGIIRIGRSTVTAEERWFEGVPKSGLCRLVWAAPLAFAVGVLIGVVLL